MANYLAVFSLADEMSSKLNRIANSSSNAIAKLEKLGKVAENAFAKAASGARKATASIENISDSLGDFESSAEGIGSSIDNWTTAIEKYDDGVAQAISSTEKLVDASRISSEAFEDQAKSVDNLTGKIIKYGNQNDKVADKSESFASRSKNAIKDLASSIITSGLDKTLSVVSDLFKKCSESAAVFETSTSKITATSGLNKEVVEEMSGDILDLSNDTGVAAEKLSEAVNQAVMAGIDSGKSVEFVRQANNLAVGGFIDLSEAVDILAIAVDEYGMRSSDADKISDMLINTQRLGKTTVNELSSSIGNVIPVASSLGVEMGNLSTAYVQLTNDGIKTADAGNYLKDMFSELGDSSSGVSSILLEKTGHSFSTLMEQGNSLGDVLSILGESVGGDSTKFKELWNSTSAGEGALSIFSSGAGEFNSVLEEMKNTSGTTADAYEIMADTTANSQNKMENAATNLGTVIGDQLNPVLSDLYDVGASAFDWIGDFLADNPAVTKGLIGLSSGVAAAASAVKVAAKVSGTSVMSVLGKVGSTIGKAGPAISKVGSAIGSIAKAIGPVGWTIAGIVGAVTVVTAILDKRIQELRKQNLADHFGDISLSMEEVEEVAKRIVSSDSLGKMQKSLAKFAEVEKISEDILATMDVLERLNWKVSVGLELTPKEQEAYKKNIEEFINQTNNSVDQHQYAVSLAVNLFTEDDEIGQSIRNSTNTFFADARGALEEKTNELARITTEAFADGFLNSVEADMISKAQQAVTNASNKLIQSDFESKLMIEGQKLSDNNLTYESFEKVQQKVLLIEAETLDNLEKTYQIATQQKILEYNNGQNPNMSLEKFNNEIENMELNYKKQQIEISAKVTEFTVGTIYKAYPDLVRGIILSNDIIQEAAEKSKTSEYFPVEDVKYKIQNEVEKANIDEHSYENAKEIYDKYKLRVNAQANLISQLTADGQPIDESIAKSQLSADALGVIFEDDDSLMRLIGYEANKNPKAQNAIDYAIDNTGMLREENQKNYSVGMNINKVIATYGDDDLKKIMKERLDGVIIDIGVNFVPNKMGVGISELDILLSKPNIKLTTPTTVATPTTAATSGISMLGQLEHYAKGTDSATSGFAIVGEDGPELVSFRGGEEVYTAEETKNILSSSPLRTSVPESFERQENDNTMNNTAIEKKITLEIAGSGEIEISEKANKESVLNTLVKNIKPVLMGILKQEIYEEGDLAYDF